MGFPDNYTLIDGNSDTNRYHAVGNSWAVPVVKWIGEQIYNYSIQSKSTKIEIWNKTIKPIKNNLNAELYLLQGVDRISPTKYLNNSISSNNPTYGDLKDIPEVSDVPEKFYISPKACKGILRRKDERNINMNTELEKLMQKNANLINSKEEKIIKKMLSKSYDVQAV